MTNSVLIVDDGISSGARRYAKELIDILAEQGLDYSMHLDAIAERLWDNGVWQGNDTNRTRLEDSNLQDLVGYQEDHYDQHMDEDEDKPEWGTMIASVGGVYVWFK